MQLLISDANILIDLEVGELTGFLFQLPYDFSIPDSRNWKIGMGICWAWACS